MSLPYTTSAGLPWGTRILTISGTSYVCNSFNVEQNGQLIERNDHIGAPNGAVLLRRAFTGTAELQLASNTTAYPNASMEFSAYVPQANANLNFFIMPPVGAPEQQDQFKVCSITFREVA